MENLNKMIKTTVKDLLELNGWTKGTQGDEMFFKDIRQVNVTDNGVAFFIQRKHTYHVELIRVLDDGMMRYIISS